MDEVFVVVRPSADFDFVFQGAFSTYEVASKCAEDTNYDYDGTVYRIKLNEVKDEYLREDEKENQNA